MCWHQDGMHSQTLPSPARGLWHLPLPLTLHDAAAYFVTASHGLLTGQLSLAGPPMTISSRVLCKILSGKFHRMFDV